MKLQVTMFFIKVTRCKLQLKPWTFAESDFETASC